MYHQLLCITVGFICKNILAFAGPIPLCADPTASSMHVFVIDSCSVSRTKSQLAPIPFHLPLLPPPPHSPTAHPNPLHSPPLPTSLLPLLSIMILMCYYLFCLQSELTQKGQQLGNQTQSIAALTKQHNQLTAAAQRDCSALQSLREELKAKTGHVHDLEAKMVGQHKEWQSSQHQLQQQKGVQSKLESQLELQAAELNAVSERASNLEVNKQQLQQKLDNVLCDQQQTQSTLVDERAAADRQLSALKTDVLQLQANHLMAYVTHQACTR